jgi:hypothetical protein
MNRSSSITSRSGSANGRRRSSTPFTRLNAAVFAPIPSARVRIVKVANPAFAFSVRVA